AGDLHPGRPHLHCLTQRDRRTRPSPPHPHQVRRPQKPCQPASAITLCDHPSEPTRGAPPLNSKTRDVKGVECGLRGGLRGFPRWATRRGLIFPRGLNSEKTGGEPCIRSCSVGGKWTIPVGTPGHFHRTRPCTAALP